MTLEQRLAAIERKLAVLERHHHHHKPQWLNHGGPPVLINQDGLFVGLDEAAPTPSGEGKPGTGSAAFPARR
jgi:hypothetical protein